MRRFLIYIVATSIVVLWGAAVDDGVAFVLIYLITVFDLRIASPEWSMYRRIFPSVSLIDLAVYFIPFACVVVFLAGWLPAPEQPMVGFIIAVSLLFIWGVYLLLRLPHMRRGSGDDLSWLHSPNMTFQERFRRYLGVAPGRD